MAVRDVHDDQRGTGHDRGSIRIHVDAVGRSQAIQRGHANRCRRVTDIDDLDAGLTIGQVSVAEVHLEVLGHTGCIQRANQNRCKRVGDINDLETRRTVRQVGVGPHHPHIDGDAVGIQCCHHGRTGPV